ncbi:c-type cytochrome [Pseudomonas sp. MMS21-TM103]|uniref:c-type cytochrome n=1 Tax=Pseudomonas sp. MMS21 TM103 TaxID=2886506 RepID=UPI001EDFE46B|nr:c-type cytochrome [Pseudomonas sp. MMS21 TM103]MCG4452869.1 c-type cytochrome [Pseudomonas sp. MMS21 TM103]
MKRTIKTLVAASIVASIAVTAGAYYGLVNVGADDPHPPAVYAFLAMARDRSILLRSRDIQVPDLQNQALIRAGAGNYNSMCIGCHLAPGIAATELSQSLYPAPLNLTKAGFDRDPAATFWIIKHGIKASGMPAWGKSMADPYIWGLVAFMKKLPDLDAQQYRTLVASSAGHQHGGGESEMHNHEGQHNSAEAGADHHSGEMAGMNHPDEAAADHHAGEMPGMSHPDEAAADHHAGEMPGTSHHDVKPAAAAPKPASKGHVHADGKEHLHAG